MFGLVAKPPWWVLLVLIPPRVWASDFFSSDGCYPLKAINDILTLLDSYTFQSSGHCQEKCAGKKIAAMMGGLQCYCGDVVPDSSQKVSNDNCNTPCKGYPADKCGGQDFFIVYNNAGVVALTQTVLSSSSSSPSSSSSTSQLSLLDLQKSPTNQQMSDQQGSSSLSDSQRDGSQQGQSSDQNHSSSPTTQLSSLTTVNGSVLVSVVTATPLQGSGGNSSASGNQPQSQNKGISTGSLVGAIVGLIGGVGILALLAVLFLFYRRRRDKDLQDANDAEDDFNDEFTLLGPANEKGHDSMSMEPNPFLLAGGYHNFDTSQQHLPSGTGGGGGSGANGLPHLHSSPYARGLSFSSAQGSHHLFTPSRRDSHAFTFATIGTAGAGAGGATGDGHTSHHSDGLGLIGHESGENDSQSTAHPYAQFYSSGQPQNQQVPALDLAPPSQPRRKLSTGSLPDMIARQPGSLKVVNN